MTRANMALAELAEKGADADFLRQMIEHVAQRLMDMDVEGLCAAAYGQRAPKRVNSRNSYRDRLWETRVGSVDLKIPKLRTGSYFPGFLEPRKTAEKALAAMMDDAENEELTFMRFPEAHRAQIASTNPLERVNAEVKRRTDVVGIFPNAAAIVHLVGGLAAGTKRRMAIAATLHAA